MTNRHHRRLDSSHRDVNGVPESSDTRTRTSSSVVYKWVVDLFYTKGTTNHAAIDNDRDIEIDTTSSNSFLQGLAQIQRQGQGQERGLAPGAGLYDVFVGTEDPKVITTVMATGYDIT